MQSKKEILYHALPIEKEYEPIECVLDRDDISKEELQEMPNLKLVINSEDEFPEEDLMGLEVIKNSNIDFQKYTLKKPTLIMRAMKLKMELTVRK